MPVELIGDPVDPTTTADDAATCEPPSIITAVIPQVDVVDRVTVDGSWAARSALACDAVGALEAAAGARDDRLRAGGWRDSCVGRWCAWW